MIRQEIEYILDDYDDWSTCVYSALNDFHHTTGAHLNKIACNLEVCDQIWLRMIEDFKRLNDENGGESLRVLARVMILDSLARKRRKTR